jgi:hypothetical protein
MRPPTALAIESGTSTCFDLPSSRRYANDADTAAGHNATELVAFAVTGAIPTNKSAGNVRKLPPPATEFSAPPRAAEANRSTPWSGDMTKTA